MLRRPPAKMVHLAPQEGPLGGLVTGKTGGAMVNSVKAYGGARAGNYDLRPALAHFAVVWQDFLNVRPAHEAPKLINYSAAAPLVRMAGVRRYTRTFMSASPRFRGRWFFVGYIQRHYAERARLRGIPTRQGTTYVYPKFNVPTRAVQLGPGQGGAIR
jgi:hypothetical protein